MIPSSPLCQRLTQADGLECWAMPTPEELNKSGMERYRAGDYDGAIMAYEDATTQKPDYAPCLVNLALAYLKRNRLDDAIRAGQRASALAPQAGAARYHLANAYAAKGRWNEAVSEYVRAFELDSGQLTALLLAGNQCMDHGLSAKAIELWNRFLAAAPPDHPRRAEAEAQLRHAAAQGPITRF